MLLLLVLLLLILLHAVVVDIIVIVIVIIIIIIIIIIIWGYLCRFNVCGFCYYIIIQFSFSYSKGIGYFVYLWLLYDWLELFVSPSVLF